MNTFFRSLIVSVTTAIMLSVSLTPAIAVEAKLDLSLGDLLGMHSRAKNIIFMVPDGMGLADVTAARIRKNGIAGSPLHMETLDEIGYQRTYAANNTITDSAAAASAWACGEKFNNGEICFHTDGKASNPTILELAKGRGKATGLVATSTITHATPAVFGAHVVSRGCEKEIARQYIEVTMPEVILGGGVSKFRSSTPDACGASGDFIAEAMGLGYAVAYTKDEMNAAVSGGNKRILGLFNQSGLTPEYLRTAGITEPRLPEMTKAALDILEKDRDGFFLMVEGSQIDWANHANDLEYQIGETLAFDEAVKAVKDWIDAKPLRRHNTLLIIVPDHETGGFSVNGPEDGGELGQFFSGWTSLGHTGVDTMIWSQGPGSERLGKALDNTDLYRIMQDVLR